MAVVVVRRTRKRRQGALPKWGVIRGMLHLRIKDVAAELGVSINYIRGLCHKNGHPTWPGKRIRYMNSAGLMHGWVDAPEGSPWAGLAALSQLAKVAKTKKKEANHPPREELVTLNLIDKVGSSSSSKSN